MHKSILSILLCLSTLSIFGCKGTAGPEGPAGSALTGSLTGFVTLINSDGSIPANPSGVTVSIDSTSYTTTTGQNGGWTLTGIPTGTYNISYTSAGYGLSKTNQHQVTGDGSVSLGRIYMSQPPSFSAAIDTGKSHADTNSVLIWVDASNVPKSEEVRFLIVVGTTNAPTGATPNGYSYETNLAFEDVGSGSVRISQTDLYAAGLTSGETAYVTVYPLSWGSGSYYSEYVDEATGHGVYTALGAPSNVLQLIVP